MTKKSLSRGAYDPGKYPKGYGCVICKIFESDTTPVEGFFLGLMCCVSKVNEHGITPQQVWDRALASLCPTHRHAYEGVSRHAEESAHGR